MGKSLDFILQADPFQHGQRPLPGLFLTALLQVHRGQHQVAQDIHVVEQVKMLENHAHPFTEFVDIRTGIRQVFPVDEYFA